MPNESDRLDPKKIAHYYSNNNTVKKVKVIEITIIWLYASNTDNIIIKNAISPPVPIIKPPAPHCLIGRQKAMS